MIGPRRPAPDRQCQFIVPAKVVLGVAWSPEHRCLHYVTAGGFCRQHQPPDQIGLTPEDEAVRRARLR